MASVFSSVAKYCSLMPKQMSQERSNVAHYSKVLAQTFGFVLDIPESEVFEHFGSELLPKEETEPAEFDNLLSNLLSIQDLGSSNAADSKFDEALFKRSCHVPLSQIGSELGSAPQPIPPFAFRGGPIQGLPKPGSTYTVDSLDVSTLYRPEQYHGSPHDSDRKVENLFLVALELVRVYKRPPFDINTISNEMKRIDPNYDVRTTSWGRFLELCKHMSAKGYLYLTRIGGIPMVKAYGNGTKDRSKPGHLPTMPPSRHLWVGSVGPAVSREQLYGLFAPFGHIEAVSMHTNMGYAFIDFENVTEAVRAKEHLQGAAVGDKKITINFAKGEASRSVWVGNVYDVSEDLLFNEFSAHGPIERIAVVPDTGCAYIDFMRKEDAISAFYSMQDRVINQRRIHLDFQKVRENAELKADLRWTRSPRVAALPDVPPPLSSLDVAAFRHNTAAALQWPALIGQRRPSLHRTKDMHPGVVDRLGCLNEAVLVELIKDILKEKSEVRLGELGKFLSQRTGFSFQQQQGGLKGFILRHSDIFVLGRDVLDNPNIFLRSPVAGSGIGSSHLSLSNSTFGLTAPSNSSANLSLSNSTFGLTAPSNSSANLSLSDSTFGLTAPPSSSSSMSLSNSTFGLTAPPSSSSSMSLSNSTFGFTSPPSSSANLSLSNSTFGLTAPPSSSSSLSLSNSTFGLTAPLSSSSNLSLSNSTFGLNVPLSYSSATLTSSLGGTPRLPIGTSSAAAGLAATSTSSSSLYSDNFLSGVSHSNPPLSLPSSPALSLPGSPLSLPGSPSVSLSSSQSSSSTASGPTSWASRYQDAAWSRYAQMFGTRSSAAGSFLGLS